MFIKCWKIEKFGQAYFVREIFLLKCYWKKAMPRNCDYQLLELLKNRVVLMESKSFGGNSFLLNVLVSESLPRPRGRDSIRWIKRTMRKKCSSKCISIDSSIWTYAYIFGYPHTKWEEEGAVCKLMVWRRSIAAETDRRVHYERFTVLDALACTDLDILCMNCAKTASSCARVWRSSKA